MDSFEFNKFAGAVLGTVLVVFVVNMFAGAVFSPVKPEKPGFVVEVEEPESDTAKKEEKPKVDVMAMLAAADPAKGEKLHSRCAACHTFNKGGDAKVGPNLWGIVNRPIGSVEGFKYSKGMEAFREGQTWTFEHLNDFLIKPSALVKGTTMNFPGLKKPKDRADILVYLRSLADSPAPLPEAKAATGDAGTGATEKKAESE